ncbi:MAG: divergent polysaccharide deacetylase family protein [Desulfobacteraceae bacterium]|nr:MAG: divergent polysaccharide deacetylase family protein [Desulfobacteraceae bacterium]
MAPGSRKGRKTRRRASLGRLLVYVSASALTAGVAVFLYMVWSMTSLTPPPYEEIHPIPSELNDQITRINAAVYESVYRERIPERDVLFLSVEPRQERGNEWEFTEILIRFSDPGRIRDFEKSISGNFASLGKEVQHRNVRAAGGDSIIDLFVLGYFTHRIRLAGAERQRSAKSAGSVLVSIIIDDVGYDLKLARSFMDLGVPLALSVISTAPHASVISRMAREKGCELMLHLPMEPKNYPRVNPGPGAILAKMNDETILATMEEHVKRVPGIRGVNNHMGSRLTELEGKLAVVFNDLKRRNLFYVDSRTTPRSVAVSLGRKTGVAVGTRGIFLDNHLSESAMKFQVERLLGIAGNTGGVIAIGHPHKETLKCLKDSLERIKKMGEIVPVSEFLLRRGGEQNKPGSDAILP